MNQSNENETNDKEGIVKEAQINNSYKSCCHSEVSFMFSGEVKNLNEFIYKNLNSNSELSLKEEFFDKNLQSADLVTETATRTSCFTKK